MVKKKKPKKEKKMNLLGSKLVDNIKKALDKIK